MLEQNKMKKILITFISFFLITSSNADDLSNKISNIIADLIPGEGDTEVSIDLRENHKPDYSIPVSYTHLTLPTTPYV